jgi:hypothetical protein
MATVGVLLGVSSVFAVVFGLFAGLCAVVVLNIVSN